MCINMAFHIFIHFVVIGNEPFFLLVSKISEIFFCSVGVVQCPVYRIERHLLLKGYKYIELHSTIFIVCYKEAGVPL